MERAVALSEGSEIHLEDLAGALEAPGVRQPILPPEGMAGVSLAPVVSTLAHAKDTTEVAQILRALRKHKNNRLRAAAELGISRMTLYNKLRRYGLQVQKVNDTSPSEE
jgi:DNA-binding NtrC family response regulator